MYRIIKYKSRGGFTLIELLVVISIIALLLSIVLPSLSAVKKKATRIDCASRLRQMGLAMLIYSDDFNKKYPAPLPPGAWPMGAMVEADGYNVPDGKPVGSPILVDSGYLSDYHILYCPQHDKTYKSGGRTFAHSEQNWDSEFWTATYISYPYWVGYAHYVETTSTSIPVLLSKLTAKDALSRGTMVVSSDLIIELPGQYYWEAVTNHTDPSGDPSGGNILYNDGHVEWKTFENTKRRLYYIYDFYF